MAASKRLGFIFTCMAIVVTGCGGAGDASESLDEAEATLTRPTLDGGVAPSTGRPSIDAGHSFGGGPAADGGLGSFLGHLHVPHLGFDGGSSEGGAQCLGPHLTACGMLCVDTEFDILNCGTCGNRCKTGEHCASGTCK